MSQRTSHEGDGFSVSTLPVPRLRRQVLRDALLPTVELLNRNQDAQLDEGIIADYVALRWLEWNGSTLCLTITGTKVCDQLRACVEEAA
jgi:hypothetical protein